MKFGDLVKLRPRQSSELFARSLVTVPDGHPPWSDDWDVTTTFAKWEVGLVVDIAHNPEGSLCVKLFTSHGGGWIEGSELTKL